MSIQRCCPPASVVTSTYEEEAALFKALADHYRLRMLATLAAADDEICVCDFTEALPLNQPTVSHHLRVLREAGLVTCERRGTWVYYKIASDANRRMESALQSILHSGVTA
jgi:ArsR family transcriptional regulator, arsenate/arsenite/antimonite-responsive transcriptional repressor